MASLPNISPELCSEAHDPCCATLYVSLSTEPVKPRMSKISDFRKPKTRYPQIGGHRIRPLGTHKRHLEDPGLHSLAHVPFCSSGCLKKAVTDLNSLAVSLSTIVTIRNFQLLFILLYGTSTIPPPHPILHIYGRYLAHDPPSPHPTGQADRPRLGICLRIVLPTPLYPRSARLSAAAIINVHASPPSIYLRAGVCSKPTQLQDTHTHYSSTSE
ncbi:hypothetical protein F5B20DRAFT_40522 [Whalleya microplaca]|nr:hypothetical protein F5B20DRAFT_40522 [Whalleya microplaca]